MTMCLRHTTPPTGARLWNAPWLVMTLRLVLAGVFIVAGVVKLSDPKAFAAVIAAYGMLPNVLIGPVALALPALEVAAGLALIQGAGWSLWALGGMLLLFMGVLGLAMHLGLDVDCGCYGPGDPEADAFHNLAEAFLRDVGLMVLVVWLALCRRAGHWPVLSFTATMPFTRRSA